MFNLSGRVAVVTGCDTGLGQGMACALAQEGCDIVGVNIVPAERDRGGGASDGAAVSRHRAPISVSRRPTRLSRARPRRSGASTSW